MKLLGDLYEDGTLSKNKIKSQLTKKSGLFFEFWQLKRAVPQSFDLIEPNQDLIVGGKEYLLNSYYEVPDSGLKPLKDLTSKDLYRIFNLSFIPEISSKRYWTRKFDTNDIDWGNWFQVNIINPLSPRSVKDFNYKIFFNLVNTETRLLLMKYSSGKCVNCKINNENLEHLLFSCISVTPIWSYAKKILDKTWPGISITKIEAISGTWKDGVTNENLMLNMVFGIIRFHIWKIRNRIKYDNEQISSSQSIRILKWELLNHLELLSSNKKYDKDLRPKITSLINRLRQTPIDNVNHARKRRFTYLSN